MKWINDHNLGIFVVVIALLILGIVIGLAQNTTTYLLVNATGSQIEALYEDERPYDEVSLHYVSGGSSYIEMKVTYIWYRASAIRNYLSSHGYEYIEQ